MTTIKINIKGTHCQSCQTRIENEVKTLAGINDISVDYSSGDTKIDFEENKVSKAAIVKKIESLNYSVPEAPGENEKEKEEKNSDKKLKRWIIGILAVLVFGVGYFIVKYFGLLEILSRLNETNLSYWLIFGIGILASFHCVGMCGGLVVTYTAASQKPDAKKKKKFAPHFQYNLGRLISYTLIGGLLGGIGSFFAINPTFKAVIILLAAVFMILMGLSLLTNNKYLNKVKLKTPKFIAKYLYGNKENSKPKGPFIIGMLTGFMPCGPLQAMQLYALASGSFWTGAASMFVYALGTIPLMFGFGSLLSSIKNEKIKKIMKFSGVVVIILGLLMLNRGLTSFGYGYKGLVSKEQTSQTEFIVDGSVTEYQTVKMELTYNGYEPNVLYVKKGVPVRWIIDVKQMSGCTDEIIMPEYNIKKALQVGENIIEFTPEQAGEIKFSCWMEMVWGKFIVTEGDDMPDQGATQEVIETPEGTSCAGNGECGGSCGSESCGCKSKIK
ncbi:sulfite exporter TauE/SafE family protein [Patescibacteria group bacterium]|nr:sulfite exporter TauE/SafE family protein [Patescibacteria group bacterium]MBU1673037.1 sulfite exporter TauE/SafE family protein [Patescibacteria group bacterium]MBU1963597.1 sulfite exporter TauE/SafE family protein [Patescibacteria group bacterium]